MIVEDGKVVSIHYTLTSDNGEQIDTSRGGEPLDYLQGASNIVPGLEKAMDGKSEGDTFQITVPPAEGYGDASGAEEAVPRDMFPDDAELQPGMRLQATTQDGTVVNLWITRVEGDTVFVGQDHPLAGENLNFDIEVVNVREASEQEKADGRAHG